MSEIVDRRALRGEVSSLVAGLAAFRLRPNVLALPVTRPLDFCRCLAFVGYFFVLDGLSLIEGA